MIQKTKRPISILLVLLMIVGMFTVLPISAGAATWTFKLGSNFSGEWNEDTDVVSEQPIELTLAAGDYEFEIVAYEDGNWSAYRGNSVAGSSTETYSQIMHDNGGHSKFHADGGKYTLTYNAGDGLLTINPVYVAEINGTNYKTLEAAFAEAQDGETITVLADCAGNGIVAPQGKFATGLTVDFNNHTYTVSGTPVGSTGTETIGFQLLKGNKITFKNGTITGDSTTNQALQRMIQNYSDLTLDKMTVSMVGQYYDQITVSTCNGKTVINDSTISAPDFNWANITDPADVGAAALAVGTFSSYPSIDVTVEGNSTINGDVNVSDDNNKKAFSLTLNGGELNGKINLDENAKAAIDDTASTANVTKADSFIQEAPEGYRWVDSAEEGKKTLAPIPYVAQISETKKYETLAEAFAAAVDGDTITLLADCSGDGIKAPQGKFATKGLTVDFAGFTYSVDGETVGSSGTETIGFQLLKDNKITFQNGTITGNSNTNQTLMRMIQNYSDLTLDKMTVSMVGRYRDQITVSTCNGKTVINNSKISAPDYTWANITDPATVGAAALAVGTFSSYPSIDVTVEGTSVINGDVNVSDDNNKKAFSLTLNGGELNGKINLDENAKAAIDDTASTANVTKADSFIQEAPEGYRWVDSAEEGKKTLAPIPYVAQISETKKYETLAEAFAAAVDGDTITLLDDCTGDGIKAPQGKFATKGLTVDFAGFTYSVDGETVGSSGTETIGFQLLKDNKITFKNGTITGDSTTNTKLQRMIQNYSDLTLDNMTVSMVGLYRDQITVSTCNGKTVINNSKISAPDYTWANITDPATVGAAALAVGTFSSYPSIDVTVEGNSTINGDVNVSDDNNKKAFSLKLNGGKLNGKINLDENAKAAIDATEGTANVTKADSFTQAAPEGYKWKDNGDGTSTLVKVPDLFTGHSITLNGYINLNFYIDTDAIPGYANATSVKAKFTWDSQVTESGKHYDNDIVEVNLDDYNPDANGIVMVPVTVNAAQMANTINAVVEVNGTPLEETDKYSVMQYAEELLAGDYTDAQKTLVKKMLNYGAMAQKVFENQLSNKPDVYADSVLSSDDLSTIASEMNDVNADKIIAAIKTANDNERGATVEELQAIGTAIGGEWYTTSVIFLSGNTLRHYFDDVNEGQMNTTGYDGVQNEWFYYVEKKNIPASQLDTLFDFSIGGQSFKYSVLDYAAALLKLDTSEDVQNLAKALYLYNQAANACFHD